MGKPGFTGFEKELAGPVKSCVTGYTHFEDPQGDAFHAFVARKANADPSCP
jgi:hypothetical protein